MSDSELLPSNLTYEATLVPMDDGYAITSNYDVLKFFNTAVALVPKLLQDDSTLFGIGFVARSGLMELNASKLGKALLDWLKWRDHIANVLHELTYTEFTIEANPQARLLLLIDLPFGLEAHDRIGAACVIETKAKALNDAVARLRHIGRGPAFGVEVQKCKRRSLDAARSLKTYLRALSAQHAKLLVLRVDFTYRHDPKVHPLGARVPPATVQMHRARLIQFFKRTFFDCQLGYIVKTEFALLRGAHLHAIFILDGSKVRSDVSIAAMLGEHWQRAVTAGKGSYFNCNRIKGQYLSCGIGLVDYRDPNDWAGAKAMVDYITKPDYIVRVWAMNFRTVVRGEMPAAAEVKLGRPRTKIYDSDADGL